MRYLNAWLGALVLAGCAQLDLSNIIVTVTPTGVYSEPSVTPSLTAAAVAAETAVPAPVPSPPPEPSGMICDNRALTIVCQADFCVVRTDTSGGQDAVAYSLPYGTRLEARAVCECPDCVPFTSWYWLGGMDGRSYWAVALDTVWRETDEQ